MPEDKEGEQIGSCSPDDEKPSEPTKDETQAKEPEKKPSIVKRLWAKTGLEPPVILLMLKGALPPIIAISAYESDAWSRKYSTLGYLVAIMSLISMAIQPRAKFLQAMMISIFFTCVGASVALLQIQCVVSAREQTTVAAKTGATVTGSSGSQQSVSYNSSASAVAAVFLFATIYLANTIRAKRPQLMLQIIQYSIFTIVASTYAATFPNMTAGKSFVKRLLETFLTGFGIATGVSLFVIPMTSRTIAGKQLGGMLALMKACIGAHGAYMHSVSKNHQDRLGDFSKKTTQEESSEAVNGKAHKKKAKVSMEDLSAEAKAMKGLVDKIGALFGKTRLELSFAKREIAYGKLRPDDYSEIQRLMREILLPIFGMSTFIDIMQSAKEMKTERRAMIGNNETVEAIRRLESDEWDEVMAMSHNDYQTFRTAMLGGLTHIGLVLEFEKRPKKAPKDAEKAEMTPKPGDANFAAHLEKAITDFHSQRETIIQTWCEKKGVGLPNTFWDDPSKHFSMKDLQNQKETMREKLNQQQLYLILYLGYLTWSMGHAILDMVVFSDSKFEDGTMKRGRLIIPAWKRLKRFFTHIFTQVDTDDVMYDGENAATSVWMGDSLKRQRDPEHLPPTNAYQKATNYLRAIPHFFGSDASAFGFRAAVATLSIGVMAYIKQTHTFYLRERLLWSMIMVAISMSAHAGQGVFGFVARIFGTAVAACSSIIIWYVGGQKTAAIIPLFYIYLCGGILFLVKNPELAIVGIISMVTGVLILGYELQERKIGLKLATSNGQPFYKIYILAPYRLAAVIAGLAVNFIWTYFPYPVTTHATLRKDLGATLYLLANFYSCVHTTVECRLRLGQLSDPMDTKSALTKLDKSRHKVFGKCITMLNTLREHSRFTKFEPEFGGKFPKAKYDELIGHMQHVFNYTSMVAYSSKTFASQPDEEQSAWLKDFRHFTSDLNLTSHQVTSTLCMMSASIRNSQPLPPYLNVPKAYALADRMESIDPELLSVKHVAEPCYAAFAVLEVASSLIAEEMQNIVKKVQDLVGEVDFSFHVISTSSDASSTASTLLGEKEQKKD